MRVLTGEKDTVAFNQAAGFDRDSFVQDYLLESREYLSQLEEICIGFTRDDRNESLFKELLRILHTLKGTSRIMEFQQIEKVVHETENVFKKLSGNHFEISRTYVTFLLTIIEILKAALEAVEECGCDSIENFDFVIENIRRACNGETFSEDFKTGKKEEADFSEKNGLFHDSKTIKIQVSDVNSILQSLDKLLIRQIRLKNELAKIKAETAKFGFDGFREIDENLEVLEKQSFDIQEKIIALRMLPFDMILQPLKHSVASEAIKLGKNVEFEIPSTEITIDKSILEKLPKILLHLVRNSLDHGIESPEERKALGKNENGLVRVNVSQNSNRIIVTVSDDGRGLDFEKIRSKAMERFIEKSKEISKMNEDELVQFIFLSGFSTREEVSELSGRGIGMDVVRSEMDALKGKISISSEKNKGTKIELSLPSSLATQDGLFVRQGRNLYLILSHYISEILTVPQNLFLKLQKGPVINLHNELLPVYDFDAIIGKLSGTFSGENREVPLVVIEYLNSKIAVTVDEILHYKTVVIKPVPNLLKSFEGLQGVVFDENYRIIPVLNIPNCIKRFNAVSSYEVKELEVKKSPKIRSVLVVDDSHTTRNIEKIILEQENYKVSVACDGIEALEKMKSCNFDLVVTDIKMPRMDGFDLLHNMRHTESLKKIPVIIVSSVYEKDIENQVKNLGAQGYIVKSDFERENLTAKARELLADE